LDRATHLKILRERRIDRKKYGGGRIAGSFDLSGER